MTRAEVIEEARKLIGTPWQHQGRQPGIGIDCAGVIVHLLRLQGIGYDVAGYAREPNGELLSHAKACLVPIARDAYQPADVVIFRLRSEPQHVALITDKGMLHALGRPGPLSRVTEHGLTDQWRRQIVAAYSFPGIE